MLLSMGWSRASKKVGPEGVMTRIAVELSEPFVGVDKNEFHSWPSGPGRRGPRSAKAEGGALAIAWVAGSRLSLRLGQVG